MKIKTKLMINVLVTAFIVTAISFASYLLMKYLQEKLSYLTEKSTPFQIRTIELQREMQGCISLLVKVNSARNIQEYSTFRKEAEKSLNSIVQAQNALGRINGTAPTVSDDLARIASELFSASEERIKSNDASLAAIGTILKRIKESSGYLKELESSIRNLQNSNSRAFAGALQNTATYSGRLQSIEELRNLVREQQLLSQNVQNISSNTSILIAKGKLKAIFVRITKNDYYNANKSIAAIVSSFSELLNEYVRLKSVSLANNDTDSRNAVAAIGKDIPDKLGALFQTLDQESVLARDELAFAGNNQESNFSRSNSANDILVLNAELVALGFKVTGEVNRLFIVDSLDEVSKSAAEILSIFTTIHERAQNLENHLGRLGAKNELKLLHTVHSSLEAIKTDLYSGSGIIEALKKKLHAIDKANTSGDKLHTLVLKQIASGNESVSSAQMEQEKSIIAVNNVVRQSLFQILAIGIAAIAIGTMFGFWIYRTVLKPLRVVQEAVSSQQRQAREKAALAEAVTGGDLSRDVNISKALTLDLAQSGRYDEISDVLKSVVEMSEAQVVLDGAFAEMTASLRKNRDDNERRSRLKGGLFDLGKILRAEGTAIETAENALAYIASFIGAGVGVMYVYDEQEGLIQTIATYAIARNKRLNDGFMLGEGLVGQVASSRKMICIESLPQDYLQVSSALGLAAPLNVAVMPILYKDSMVGVLELGSFRRFNEDDFEFLRRSLDEISITIKVNRSRQLADELLEQTQSQAEELRVQQEELQQTNEELMERARMLEEQRRDSMEPV